MAHSHAAAFPAVIELHRDRGGPDAPFGLSIDWAPFPWFVLAEPGAVVKIGDGRYPAVTITIPAKSLRVVDLAMADPDTPCDICSGSDPHCSVCGTLPVAQTEWLEPGAPAVPVGGETVIEGDVP